MKVRIIDTKISSDYDDDDNTVTLEGGVDVYEDAVVYDHKLGQIRQVRTPVGTPQESDDRPRVVELEDGDVLLHWGRVHVSRQPEEMTSWEWLFESDQAASARQKEARAARIRDLCGAYPQYATEIARISTM